MASATRCAITLPLPLQSGIDRTLARMHPRLQTAARYLRLSVLPRAAIPDLALPPTSSSASRGDRGRLAHAEVVDTGGGLRLRVTLRPSRPCPGARPPPTWRPTSSRRGRVRTHAPPHLLGRGHALVSTRRVIGRTESVPARRPVQEATPACGSGRNRRTNWSTSRRVIRRLGHLDTADVARHLRRAATGCARPSSRCPPRR